VTKKVAFSDSAKVSGPFKEALRGSSDEMEILAQVVNLSPGIRQAVLEKIKIMKNRRKIQVGGLLAGAKLENK